MLYIIRFATDSISLTYVVVCTYESVVNELVNISLRHKKMEHMLIGRENYLVAHARQAHNMTLNQV